MSFVSPSADAALSNSPYGGTTWVSIKNDGGAVSTIVFATDGTCYEHWRHKHHNSKWQASADNTQVVITHENGSTFHYKLDADKHLVRDLGSVVYQFFSSANPDAVGAFGTPKPTLAPTSPTARLAEDQARAVVLIKGDNEEGTGFLVKMPDGPVVVTNIHVISHNPNLKITTTTGSPVEILSYKGATDRDLAIIAIKDGPFNYLPLATDVTSTVQSGDEVITPGNSEGGEVILNTTGEVLGIGPDRVEFNNPVYHGNSGGPIIDTKSGKVVGVVTEAIKVDTSDALDQASFTSRNSAIAHSMRYFGMRIDNVPHWETYDWNRFQNETAFLDQFNLRSRCLDCYLNAPDDTKPEDLLYRQDASIVKANSNYGDQITGDADVSQKMDAVRQWLADMYDLVNQDMGTIQNPNNFYSFDQQRAKDEIAYRLALKADLDARSKDISRLISMPRRNN